MRVTSLLGITAAVTLAAFALAGSSTDAAIVPSSSSQPAAPEPSSSSQPTAPVPLSSGFVTAPDEYTDFKQYSKLFTPEPHFAVFQPEGTRLQYDKDEKGRTRVIKAINDKNDVVSEILVIYKWKSNQIDSVFIDDYSQTGSTLGDSAGITFEYNEKTKMVKGYDMFTPRGSAWVMTKYDLDAPPRERPSGIASVLGWFYSPAETRKELGKDIIFRDLPYGKTMPLEMQPWDGKEVRLLPASGATNA
ncbi:hypothetical protein THASP1DRAFT_25284 [Thamnocephalis sphaerospora]|uniref:Uncharacterized protein n=1 Tax=Thamnocephalis sphaerospora TaxID=78915 RepID=A0A4P9XKP2_9FUNG|nr:hypothetical protein THASP1DRAFT_25284 [Thamnocephalis sphaerospora]|eukprot:RKP06377.1 hypothetical protein THASP1DRAFT_25284 [Thamnocephalis sphaerospora]